MDIEQENCFLMYLFDTSDETMSVGHGVILSVKANNSIINIIIIHTNQQRKFKSNDDVCPEFLAGLFALM